MSRLPGSVADWRTWSMEGQAFGLATAMVGAFGLLGIAYQQWRQGQTQRQQAEEARIAGLQADREAHVALLRMQLDDPELLATWDAGDLGVDPLTRKRHDYHNLMVSQWEISHEGGRMGDVAVWHAAAGLFTTEEGRTYWSDVRAARIATSETERARRFHQVIDEAYAAAARERPPRATARRVRAQISRELSGRRGMGPGRPGPGTGTGSPSRRPSRDPYHAPPAADGGTPAVRGRWVIACGAAIGLIVTAVLWILRRNR